jgi:hypothetical protein
MSRFENLWREECDKIHYVEIGRRIIVILKQRILYNLLKS